MLNNLSSIAMLFIVCIAIIVSCIFFFSSDNDDEKGMMFNLFMTIMMGFGIIFIGTFLVRVLIKVV